MTKNSEYLCGFYGELTDLLQRDGADYDDAASLAVMAIERAAPSYKMGMPALPYLMTIARNLGIDAWRHNPDRETRQSFGKNPDGSTRYQQPYLRRTEPNGLSIFVIRNGKRFNEVSYSTGGGGAGGCDWGADEGEMLAECIDDGDMAIDNDFVGIDAPIGRAMAEGFTLGEIANYLGISEGAARKRLFDERRRAKRGGNG